MRCGEPHRAQNEDLLQGNMADAPALWESASELAGAGQIREVEKLAKIAPEYVNLLVFHGILEV